MSCRPPGPSSLRPSQAPPLPSVAVWGLRRLGLLIILLLYMFLVFPTIYTSARWNNVAGHLAQSLAYWVSVPVLLHPLHQLASQLVRPSSIIFDIINPHSSVVLRKGESQDVCIVANIPELTPNGSKLKAHPMFHDVSCLYRRQRAHLVRAMCRARVDRGWMYWVCRN